MSSEWETTDFQTSWLISSFMTETEMLEDHISRTKTNSKTNLSLPVDTFEQVVSIRNAWSAKCHKTKEVWQNQPSAYQSIEGEGKKTWSIMPVTSSINSFVCTNLQACMQICGWFEIAYETEANVEMNERVCHIYIYIYKIYKQTKNLK